MTCALAFVDSIADEPTIRLDLSDGVVWRYLEQTDFSPPPLRQAIAQTLLTDGGVIPSSAYGLRDLVLELTVNAETADNTATALQALFRELDRPTNLLMWREFTTEPVFFRTFRASADAVRRSGASDGTRKRITVQLKAEYAAYGLLETPVSGVTVSTDPAATNNGCFVDVDFATPSNANPYFETDVSNWSGLNGASLSRSTAQFHQGVASMLISPNGSTADPQAQSEAIVVAGGQSWFASAWLRSPGTPIVGATIRWFSNAAGDAFISDSQFLAAVTANTWTYSSVTGVAPANAIRARLVVKYSGTPSAGTTLFVDEAILGPSQGIKGDVEAPSIIRWPHDTVTTDSHQAMFATRRRGNPSAAPFFIQAESMTQGIDTTVQANDANMSGAGNNFSRTTFATAAAMGTRLSVSTIGTASVDLRGRYRVLLRYRRSSATGTINVRLRWGAITSSLIANDAVPTIVTANTTSTVDLGLINIPQGLDPVTGPDGVELPVSNALILQVQAERLSGTSTFDSDLLALVPADDRQTSVAWHLSGVTGLDHYLLNAADNSIHGRDSSGRVFSVRAPSLTGGLPMLSPGQTNRIYMLRNIAAGQLWALTTVSPVSVSYHPRYLSVRPAST